MYAITGLFKGHLFDLPFYWFLEMRYIKRELWDSWGGGGGVLSRWPGNGNFTYVIFRGCILTEV